MTGSQFIKEGKDLGDALLGIDHCEVCGSTRLSEALDLGLQPLCDDLIPVGRPEECTRYPIKILYCARCRTAHQKYQIPKKVLFPASYHYRSRFTMDVLNGMWDLVDSCRSLRGTLEGATVVDVGCNDGSLLRMFRESGCKVIGVEPTDAARDAATIADVVNDYFTPVVAERIRQTRGSIDVITFTNVFAHIENLAELLKAVALLTGPETLIVVENHYLGSILKGDQFDTFYHEHPRTYSATSFRYIAETLDCRVCRVEFPGRYGGNIRVFMSRSKRFAGNDPGGEPQQAEYAFDDQMKGFGARYSTWRADTSGRLSELAATQGPVHGKAFPGRASIVIAVLGLQADQVPSTFEKPGSPKIGNYVPGTRVTIESDDDLVARVKEDGILINFAWHIQGEIKQYLLGLGFRGTLITLLPRYTSEQLG